MPATASHYKAQLAAAFAAAGREIAEAHGVAPPPVVLEKPRAAAHGDYACPLAMALARVIKQPPRELAAQLAEQLQRPDFVGDVQVAGPGYINITIKPEAKIAIVGEILAAGADFGKQTLTAPPMLIEFVSANPTGPLHVGHGRAVAYGDSLANILRHVGVAVHCEYYVNNAGRQMNILAASVWLRHCLGQGAISGAMPEGLYRGDYLVGIAASATLAAHFADTPPPDSSLADLLSGADSAAADAVADKVVAAAQRAFAAPEKFTAFSRAVCDLMMDSVIKEDMRVMGADVARIQFFPETDLYDHGKVEAALDTLRANGYLQDKDGALWFKSSLFGDEKDRVVRRSNGEYTYFAADIAYHYDKLTRAATAGGADVVLLNVLGADHHGYVPRLQAVIAALGFAAERLETQIIQLVSLSEDGERVKMSTRAGEFVALRELVEEIGADAARYFYINRKNDRRLEFDLAVAKAQNNDNPVYYIQYARARIHSVFAKWGGDPADLTAAAGKDMAALAQDAAALRLAEKLGAYPETLRYAATERAPHILAAYLHDLAATLHTYYEKTRILRGDGGDGGNGGDAARLALMRAVAVVLDGAANLLGVRLPDKM